jgi:hypothetical protein
MSTSLVEVGAGKFGEELTRYLESETPLAITRDGRTVGYYIPARTVQDEELDSLRRAVEHLEVALAERGVSEDEILREFRARRAQR